MSDPCIKALSVYACSMHEALLVCACMHACSCIKAVSVYVGLVPEDLLVCARDYM